MTNLLAYSHKLNRGLAGQVEGNTHAYGFRRCARTELARVEQDMVAQVMSFIPLTYVRTLPGRFSPSIHHYTLAAVAPSVRLCAEALVNHSSTNAAFEGTQVDDEEQLVYWIRFHGREPSFKRLEHALWWSQRCAVPVVLDVPNACRRLLEMLTAAWRRRVVRLRLLMRATTVSDNQQHPYAIGEEGDDTERVEATSRRADIATLHSATSTPNNKQPCATFLGAASTFPSLEKLSIDGEFAADPVRAARAVTRAFSHLSCLSVKEMEVHGCTKLTSLSGVEALPYLERLTVCKSGVRNLIGVQACPALLVLTVSHNTMLTDLSALAGAPQLRLLRAEDCSIACVTGLSACTRLRVVSLANNRTLTSLSGLAASPRLRVLDVSWTAVRDVSVLLSCPNLLTVNVTGCTSLRVVPHLPNTDIMGIGDDVL